MTAADDNCSTRTVPCHFVAPWSEATRLLGRAIAVLPFLPRDGARFGYRLFVSSAHTVSFCDVVEGEHVVFGRHSQADLIVGHSELALRHLLLTVGRDEEGSMELRVHDLRAGLPFFVGPVALPRRAAAARGPVVLRVGSAVVFALPFVGCLRREDRADVVNAPPPLRVVGTDDDASHDAALVEAERADGLLASVSDPRTRSDVYEAIESTSSRCLPGTMEVPATDRKTGPPWMRLDLHGPGGRRRITLSETQVASPLLIGRYARCTGGARQVFSDHVSRVHAAIVRDGDGVVVHDLASTNGLALEGRPVRTVRVRDRASIDLTGDDRVVIRMVGARGR